MKTLDLINKYYLLPEEEIYLIDRTNFIIAVWKDIIFKFSNNKINDLDTEKINILNQCINEFGIVSTDKISNMDKNFVLTILSLAEKLNRKDIVNMIFKRTKNAIPKYFYAMDIMNSYLKLLDIESAKKVIDYMNNKQHIAYWYAIYYMDLENDFYKNYPEFYKYLKQKHYESIIKLTNSGENIIINFNKNFMNELKKYM